LKPVFLTGIIIRSVIRPDGCPFLGKKLKRGTQANSVTPQKSIWKEKRRYTSDKREYELWTKLD